MYLLPPIASILPRLNQASCLWSKVKRLRTLKERRPNYPTYIWHDHDFNELNISLLYNRTNEFLVFKY